MFQHIRTLIFGRGKGASTKAPGKYLQPIVDHGPAYEYPPMWRKEWDRKHAERNAARLAAVTMDPIDALNQSLKAAGIHPSQIDPVVLHESGDIFPHVEVPKPPVHFVRAMPPDVKATFKRKLGD